MVASTERTGREVSQEVERDLRLEGRIRAISWSCVLQGVCAMVAGAWYSTADVLPGADGQSVGSSLGRDAIAGVAAAMGVGFVAMGIGLRRLAPAARWITVIVAGVMLLGSLPGKETRGDVSAIALVEGYATTALLAAAAIGLVGRGVGRLFEDDYRQAMREDPDRRASARSSAFFVLAVLTALLVLTTAVSSLLTRPPPIRPAPSKAPKGTKQARADAPAPLPAPDPSRWPAYVVESAPPLGWKQVVSAAEGFVVTAPEGLVPFTDVAPSPGGEFGLAGRRVEARERSTSSPSRRCRPTATSSSS